MTEFQAWPKIPRYKREVCVTEKIDGTNAAVVWAPVTPAVDDYRHLYGFASLHPDALWTTTLYDQHGAQLGVHQLFAQSRTRFIKPGADNYGFAQWVLDNKDELVKLGPGYHYGEWWGSKIGRGYGRAPGDRHFSLFAHHRWKGEHRPACCEIVPVLGWGKPEDINQYVEQLRHGGSIAAPGFMDPEGVVVYHSQSKQMYKILMENDDTPKGDNRVKDQS
jgi:hypothetical protein